MIRSCPQTTLRSLFVSAMAVSALLPASEGPIQASPVNANPAFESLRATASSWGASDTRVVAAPAPSATPKSAASTIAPPALTQENLRKLLRLTAENPKTATVKPAISRELGLTTGEEEIVLKAISLTVEGFRHAFTVHQKEKTDDILIVVRSANATRTYLTSQKLVLRAVCDMPDGGQAKLIPNEKAQADFDKELKILNDAANQVPGNA